METNKMIAVALIVVIAILIIGLAAIMPGFGKDKTNITITGNDTIKKGDSIKIKLTDTNGTPLDNQTINITIKDKQGKAVKKAKLTDKKGVAKIKMDTEPGNYTVNCTFNGNDNFTENTTSIQVEVRGSDLIDEPEPEPEPQDDDPGAFYSAQAGRVIYTGEIQEGPDGNFYRHLGYNEWELV